MSFTLLLTLLGFGGGIAVLASYAGAATGRLDPQGAASHLLNGVGAVLLVGAGLAAGAWPSVGVNGIWTLISLFGLRSVVRSRRPRVTFEPPTAELRRADPPTAELAAVC